MHDVMLLLLGMVIGTLAGALLTAVGSLRSTALVESRQQEGKRYA